MDMQHESWDKRPGLVPFWTWSQTGPYAPLLVNDTLPYLPSDLAAQPPVCYASFALHTPIMPPFSSS